MLVTYSRSSHLVIVICSTVGRLSLGSVCGVVSYQGPADLLEKEKRTSNPFKVELETELCPMLVRFGSS